MNSQLTPEEIAEFDAAWHSKRPESRPIGYELRATERPTWVRFHSLPESKRYADNQAEYDELLNRHITLIEELCSASDTAPDDLRVVTAAWSESSKPVDREQDLINAFPLGTYWLSVQPDEDDEFWTHLYVARSALDDAALRNLLTLVADYVVSHVIISPDTLDWLYHPYDGGSDVIAPDEATKNWLRTKHSDWLSAHPLGL